MTICNYCERRETRSNIFPMPFTCNQCKNDRANYINTEIDYDDDIITYIDANNKHININSNTELNIELIDDKPIDTNNFKDALLACLYSRVDDLKNELAEKNFIIRSLVIKKCEVEHHEQEVSSSSISNTIDLKVTSEWALQSTSETEGNNNNTITNANSTEIELDSYQEEESGFAELYPQFVADSEREKSTDIKLQRQIKEVRDEKHYDYINSLHHINKSHDEKYISPDSTESINKGYTINETTTGNERFEWEKYSTGVASKIMDKMGYKGKGLGKNENGITEPIAIDYSHTLGKTKQPTKRKKILYILSSSMLNQMDEHRLSNSSIDVKIHCHGGCTISCLYSHLPKMFRHKPDYILLHIGSNDCTSKISDIILEEYKKLTTYIANELPSAELITSLPIVRADSSRANAVQQNYKLKLQGLNFMCLDHSNVSLLHLGKKGLHLNHHGTKIVAKNIISLVKRL